jgi:C1A family cysteine protease
MIARSFKFWKWMFRLAFICLLLLNANLSFSAEIDMIRRAINSRGAKWIAPENPISLLPREERRKRLGAFEEPVLAEKMVDEFFYAPASVPSIFDWRNVSGNNFVTLIRDQGSCGDCWAFAVTAALESKALITFNWPGTDLNLSEQIVLSCSGAGSCSGGSPGIASNFFKTTGTNLEGCYPYTAQDGNCSSACPNWQNSTYKIDNWNYVSSGTPPAASALKNAIYTNGPVVAGYDVYTDFFSYHSGVYSYVSGQYEGGHGILIVGWNDDDSAFIVKNSWGTGWGESGYFRIAYSELTGTTRFARTAYSYGNVIMACSTPSTPGLSSPANGSSGISITPTLDWSDVSGATSYDVQVCSDSACSSVVRSANALSSSQWAVSPALNQGTKYWWRARANNSCGPGSYTETWSFTPGPDITPPLSPKKLRIIGFVERRYRAPFIFQPFELSQVKG